jgi:hypothetical protein
MKPRAEESNRADEAVARILDRIELEDPPEDLRENVLRAIGTRPEPARSGWFEALRAGVRKRFTLQLVPFAVGAAAGVILFALASGSGVWRAPGTEPVEGVMAPLGSWSGNGGKAVLVDDQRFELGRANVRFEVQRSGNRAVVSVQADAPDPIVVMLQVAPGAARVERLLTVPSASGGTEYGPNWVRIRQSGRDRVEIGLAVESGAGDAPIRIVVEGQGGTVQGALRASRVPAGDAAAGTAK